MNSGNYITALLAAALLFAPLGAAADFTDDFDGISLDSSIWTAAASGGGTATVGGSAVTLVNPTSGTSQRSLIISKDTDVQPFTHDLQISVSGLSLGGTSGTESSSAYNGFQVAIGERAAGGGADNGYYINYMTQALGFMFEQQTTTGSYRLRRVEQPWSNVTYSLSAIPTDFTLNISSDSWTIDMVGATHNDSSTITGSFGNFNETGLAALTGDSYLVMGVFNYSTVDVGTTADIGSVSVTGTSSITPPPVIEPAVCPPAPVLNANPIPHGYIASTNDYTQIVYIDPTAPSGGNGSLAAPFTSWSGISFSDNTAYLQKCGTTNYISAKIYPAGADGLLFGAYSDGSSTNRPVIYATTDVGHIVDFGGADCTIRDMEITSADSLSCIRFATWSRARGGTVYNCYLHGVSRVQTVQYGIRIMGHDNDPNRNVRVLNTTIDWIGEDGIYVGNTEDVTIGYCNIIHINQDWFISHDPGISGGDSIQFNGVIDGYHVHHNVLDRSDTGNKFCFIANVYVDNVSGVIENNYMIGPLGSHVIYLGGDLIDQDSYHVVVRNNVLISNVEAQSGYGIYSGAGYPTVHHNLFKGFEIAIGTPDCDVGVIDHNTFVDITDFCFRDFGNVDFAGILRNNIFDIPEATTLFEHSYVYSATNNFFTQASQAMGINPSTGMLSLIDSDQNLYLPTAQSENIDEGIWLAEYAEDAHGNAYVNTPDPGCLEYGAYSAPVNLTVSSGQIELEPASGASAEHYLWLSTFDLSQPFQLLQAVTNAHIEVSTFGQTNEFFQLLPQGGSAL